MKTVIYAEIDKTEMIYLKKMSGIPSIIDVGPNISTMMEKMRKEMESYQVNGTLSAETGIGF